MRTAGRHCKYNEDVLKAAVKDYLFSDKTLDEIAEKYELTKAVVHYHTKKFRKETEGNAQENLKRA